MSIFAFGEYGREWMGMDGLAGLDGMEHGHRVLYTLACFFFGGASKRQFVLTHTANRMENLSRHMFD